MVFICFQVNGERYAIAASEMIEALPLIHIKPLPRAIEAVAGLFNYRGQMVPAIDLTQIAGARPSERRFSTRILVVRYPTPNGMEALGLIAEKATESFRKMPSEFEATGVRVDGAPYLGPATHDSRGIIQWVQPEKLLPEAVRDLLFTQELEQDNAAR